LDLRAQVVTTLNESLQDSLDEEADPTSAHCRYVMVSMTFPTSAIISVGFCTGGRPH